MDTISAATASCEHARPTTIWRLVAPHASPIIEMHKGADDLHVFCIHSVTGDVSGLENFASAFGRHRLRGIQVPKHEMKIHFASSVEAIAERHVSLLEAQQLSKPICLIGWSAGAIVALEMAQQLRARGRDVALLVALDGAPCNTGAGLARRDLRYMIKVLMNVPRWLRDDRSSDWSLSGIRTRLVEKIAARRGAGTFEDLDTLDASAVAAVVSRPGWSPAQKAFVHTIYSALAAYRSKTYSGKVLVFETRTQPLFHLRQVGAAWRAIADDCEIVPVAGNHSGLIHEPTSSLLATAVVERIDALVGRPSPSGRPGPGAVM